MLFRELDVVLIKNGFNEMPTYRKYLHLYQKKYETWDEYLFVIEYEWCDRSSVEESKSLIEQVEHMVKSKSVGSELTTIVITKNVERYRDLATMSKQPWILDEEHSRLMVYESEGETNQGLKQQIEKMLDEEMFFRSGNVGRRNRQALKNNLEKLPICTIVLVAMNVLAYMILKTTCSSDYEYESVIDSLGTQVRAIFNQHEYYRLITAIFLHANLEHLLGNMIWLAYLGQILEKRLKPVNFLVLYFGSGLFADFASLLYNMVNHEMVVSIGASGAIFGLVGALLYIVLKHKKGVEGISVRQVVLCVVFSLYAGFTAEHIDNAAHIGGCLAGCLIAILICPRNKYKLGGKS